MFNKLFATKDDFSTTVLRLVLGVVMFAHGSQKVLGWFGGHGFAGTMHFFTDTMGIPYLLALLAVLSESLGSVGLIVGLFTRISAFGIGVTIGVAALMVHVRNGFFMNWFGTQAGEGYEYHLLVVGMALALIIAGGGHWSLDSLISNNIKRRQS
ncbi:MAG: DoxX family protein [Desulfocapsaceae bacterium]|nr:DoxX family protein [Desulfocapsaceae bacterium]